MKEITLKLYNYSELPENVRKQIIEEKRFDVMHNVMEYWNEEWLATLNKFEEITNTRLSYYEVNYCCFRCGRIEFNDEQILGNWEHPMYANDIKGKYLFRYLNNQILPYIQKYKTYWGKSQYVNGKYHSKKRTSRIIMSSDECALTGYIGDIPFVKTILDYCREWNKHPETTLEDLYKECYNTFLRWWHDDYQGCDEDSFVDAELSESNCLYYENGTEFK